MTCAQDYASPEPVEIGKELSRTTFVVYPTAEEAAAGSHEASKYFTPLAEWEKTTTEAGTEFSTKFTVPFAWVNRQVLLHVEWACPVSYTHLDVYKRQVKTIRLFGESFFIE